jgi:hypothetical protein
VEGLQQFSVSFLARWSKTGVESGRGKLFLMLVHLTGDPELKFTLSNYRKCYEATGIFRMIFQIWVNNFITLIPFQSKGRNILLTMAAEGRGRIWTVFRLSQVYHFIHCCHNVSISRAVHMLILWVVVTTIRACFYISLKNVDGFLKSIGHRESQNFSLMESCVVSD